MVRNERMFTDYNPDNSEFLFNTAGIEVTLSIRVKLPLEEGQYPCQPGNIN